MTRISALRRTVQIICFFAIVFGGFLFVRPAGDGPREIVDESGYGGRTEPSSGIRLVNREKARLNVNLPVTSCYYQHRGLFTGCGLAFITEHLTWLTPLVYIIPQLLILLVLMFAFGRLWCGWVCPFGFLSDMLTFLRRATGLDHWQLSRRWRNALVWIKYGLLTASVVIALIAALRSFGSERQSMLLAFCQICLGRYVSPLLSGASVCWTNFASAFTATLTFLGFVVVAFFFVGLFVRRAYCRICPIGGLSALFNRIGLVSLEKLAQKCTNCGACARVCPVDNLTVLDTMKDGSVDACECTLCLRCVDACPEPGCLELRLATKRIVQS